MNKDLFNYTMNTLFAIGFALLLIGIGLISIEYYKLSTVNSDKQIAINYLNSSTALKYVFASMIGLIIMAIGCMKRTR